jgi:hypothetical protein
MKTVILITPLLVLSACSSPRSNVTEKDNQGNYVTTSEYQSMERTEFQVAMKAGLQDFDKRLTEVLVLIHEEHQCGPLLGRVLTKQRDGSVEIGR